MPNDENIINILKREYPWPETKPEFKEVEWGLDGGGKKIIDDKILEKEAYLVL